MIRNHRDYGREEAAHLRQLFQRAQQEIAERDITIAALEHKIAAMVLVRRVEEQTAKEER